MTTPINPISHNPELLVEPAQCHFGIFNCVALTEEHSGFNLCALALSHIPNPYASPISPCHSLFPAQAKKYLLHYIVSFLIGIPHTGLHHTLHQLVFKRQALIYRQLQPDNHVDLVYIIFLLLELAILLNIVNYSKFSMHFCVPSERQLIQGTIDEEQDLETDEEHIFYFTDSVVTMGETSTSGSAAEPNHIPHA